ncbi:MAG: alcohol dehydrogenase catalytic domain-containing protein [Armatimonadetes bacterium]|nr:alcohol dehydrogenase catalytic domain-containing protein [Armatimonadota bacterium]
MKAVVLRETGRLAVEDVPKPPLGPDEVMVRVTDCGICGSDIRYFHGENPWAQHTLGEMRTNPRNIIPGHEVAGVVEEVGENASGSLLGKRVAVLSFRVDETCYWCRRGERQLCPNTQHMGHGAGWGERDLYYGGMAEYVPVWETHVFPLPDHISNEEATILDPLAVAVHAIERAKPIPGETALVMGTGVIGLCAIQVLKAYGASEIICADVDDLHVELGSKVGANHKVNVRTQDLSEVVDELTHGVGVRIIIDSVGRPLKETLLVLARGGRLINLAVHDRSESVNQLMLAGEKTVTTAANFKYEEYPVAMDLLCTGRVNAQALITHRFPIDDAIEAFRVADQKEQTGAVKVLIKPLTSET